VWWWLWNIDGAYHAIFAIDTMRHDDYLVTLEGEQQRLSGRVVVEFFG
jgi:hypothetical protein